MSFDPRAAIRALTSAELTQIVEDNRLDEMAVLVARWKVARRTHRAAYDVLLAADAAVAAKQPGSEAQRKARLAASAARRDWRKAYDESKQIADRLDAFCAEQNHEEG